MKKIVIVIFVIILCTFFNIKQDVKYLKDESIRFRIIPNSNNEKDIFIKEKILENLQKDIKEIENYYDINITRKIINKKISNIEDSVKQTMLEYKYDSKININYGLNFFPEKNLNNTTYKEGYYESLVIKIGKGEGNNFWCIMYPPLCFLEAKKNEKVEYKFKIIEIFNKIFGL